MFVGQKQLKNSDFINEIKLQREFLGRVEVLQLNGFRWTFLGTEMGVILSMFEKTGGTTVVELHINHDRCVSKIF